MSKLAKLSDKPVIHGTGLVALDIVISANPNEPIYQWAGGTCGNVLTILSYLGWSSFPVSRLKTDESSSVVALRDMKKWKVRLDYAEMEPLASIPVITQEISISKSGLPKHKFHWRNCPKCGSYLPNYSPVTLKATSQIKEKVKASDLYFFDRVSPGALDLARHFKDIGAIVFFEPSAKGNLKHFEEAIKLADIVKYSNQRFTSIITDSIEKYRPFLEIQTLGENGLRYRTQKGNSWTLLPAFEAEDVKDTCGCGDWTTTGIIDRLCQNGKQHLLKLRIQDIKQGLRYGQALGAWNCGFEGARSGMYAVTKSTFNKEIDLILEEGVQKTSKSKSRTKVENVSDGLCPACPH